MNRLKKNKGKITAVLIVALLLIIAYLGSGETTKDSKSEIKKDEAKILILPQNDKETIAENSENYEETPESESENETDAAEFAETDDKKTVCTLSVRCDTINQNIELLDKSKRGLIPSDGVIFKHENVVFEDGESVFDVLLRETKNSNIHFEYVNMPMYDSAYIEGINNIYEFDCGELSGWMYRVNGVFPGSGCSQYKVKDKDVIEVVYTCDMGKDVGKN